MASRPDPPVPDLLELTGELVAITSVSGDEEAIAARVASELSAAGHLEVTRLGNNVVARTTGRRSRRILLGGHLDTVDVNQEGPARVEGDTCYGLGSADMKGGLAVLLHLAREEDLTVETTYVFYVREIARSRSGLLEIEASAPELLRADAAVLLEPTSNVVEAGCQGIVRVRVRLAGRAAHSARPWTGVNALHRLGELIGRVAGFEGRRPVIEGCTYRESLQVVQAEGGAGGNVVPAEASAVISYRFSPDQSVEEAVEALTAYLKPGLETEDEIVIEERAPAAAPHLGDPTLARLVDLSANAPRAKVAWTDVAFFAARSIPAANFGPGDPELAHTSAERISRADLETCLTSLRGLLRS